MRSHEDALRSIRKWLGVLLPEPWDIGYTRTEDMERPCGFVIPATRGTNTGSAYVRDVARDYDVFLYPPGLEGDAYFGRQEAEQLGQAIDAAMTRGLRIAENGPYYSYSMRLPVFDYDGIPREEGLPDGAEPYDFYPVSNWSVEPRVDPDDDTLFTVVAELRLKWRTLGDTRRFDGPVLQDVVVHHP